MSTVPERIAFIRKIYLFSELSEDDLKDVAEALTDETFEDGEDIIKQGTTGETFYILFRGRAKVTRRRRGRDEALACLSPRDFFGEEELVRNRPRTATITAVGETAVLVLHRSKLKELLKRAPTFKPTLDVVIESHRLWRRLRFKWVRSDEVVYFLARKHSILLWRSLFTPFMFMFLPAFGMLWASFTSTASAFAIAAVIEFGLMLWAIWRAVDWGNDYYVVTNQRVIWVEKVVGMFDSRTEAPLHTILSVGVETDALGRVLDYGNVIIRTFVGKIPFNHVSHPRHAARMIEEYWGRSKEVGLIAEKEAMKDAIRKRLNLPLPPKPAPPPVEEQPKFSKLRRPGAFGVAISNLFKIRLEDGETVTYRKHGFVLWQQISKPSFFLFLVLASWIARQVVLYQDPSRVFIQLLPGFKVNVDTFSWALPMLGIPFLLWWIYEYIDWSNDIFQVTPDQIVDIDKTPFGTEERRVAPLENILSTNSQRIGFLGNVFNYGTVYITVGGATLEFQDVLDPATVQSDIDRRRMARQATKAAAQAALERERIAEWIATYHREAEELRRQEQQRDNPNPG